MRNHIFRCLPVLLCITIGWPGAQLAAQTPAADDRIRVEFEPDEFETRVTIHAVDGRIEWTDILRGLSRARGFDDSVLDGILPEKSIPVTGTNGRLSVTALNLVLSPHIRCGLVDAEKAGGTPCLVITLDRDAMLASQRRIKNMLRERVTQRFPTGRKYGVTMDKGWQDAPLDKRLVILVHGLQSSGSRSASMLDAPRRRGHACGVFDYPNDQPLGDSAQLLSRELRELARLQPRREICLVAHSMGGLVARAAVEDPQLDPGNVRQLILLATPNQGSLLAYFAYGLDLAEVAASEIRQPSLSAIFSGIEDGLADAQRDLRPDSVFLAKLNARPRHPAVRYTIVLGDGGPLSDEELARARATLLDVQSRNRWVQFFGSRFEAWLNDLDEVVEGRGDGAVAIKRGRLEGVEDLVTLHAGHLDFIHPNAGKTIRGELEQILLDRLK